MIKYKEQLKSEIAKNADGSILLGLTSLCDFEKKNEKLGAFTHIKLEIGQEVPYHVHEDDCEYYYVISGNGIYNDNGKELEVSDGCVTYTASGEGHSLKNTGNKMLEFIALIIKN